MGWFDDKPKKTHSFIAKDRAASIKRAAKDAEIARKEEKERRIARERSIGNIQRDARTKALNQRAAEQEAKNRLHKARKAKLASVFGGGKKKKTHYKF